jgi:hypothetical protein
MKRPKLLIATIATKETECYSYIPISVNSQYAYHYQFDFYVQKDRLSERHPAWDKILLAKFAFQQSYDYVWVIDSDLMIINHQINVFNDIILPNFNSSIIISSDNWNCARFDKPYVNTGSVIYKNTEWTKWFLDNWWSLGDGDLEMPYWEQSVFNQIIQSDIEVLNYINILPEQALNSCYPHDCNKDNQFCMHLMSIPNESRKILFEHYQTKVIYPTV